MLFSSFLLLFFFCLGAQPFRKGLICNNPQKKKRESKCLSDPWLFTYLAIYNPKSPPLFSYHGILCPSPLPLPLVCLSGLLRIAHANSRKVQNVLALWCLLASLGHGCDLRRSIDPVGVGFVCCRAGLNGGGRKKWYLWELHAIFVQVHQLIQGKGWFWFDGAPGVRGKVPR